MTVPPPLPLASPIRHLTATGFLVWEDRVLLRWHRKNCMWLPMGGHIEENEDPVQAVLREVEEESGIAAEVISQGPVFPFAYPRQLPPPVTILLERAFDGQIWHEHIDLIYFCRPVDGIDGMVGHWDTTLRWVSEEELAVNHAVSPGDGQPPVAVPEDVRVLALAAIDAARSASPSPFPL